MSTSQDLVVALKAELKAAGVTYAQLASRLGIAESSVKRIFAKADMPLSRVDDICRALKLDFAELARRVADAQQFQDKTVEPAIRLELLDKHVRVHMTQANFEIFLELL